LAKKRRFTDREREIVERIGKQDWFAESTKWFKEQVESKKDTIKLELIEEVEKEAKARAYGEGAFHLKDVCKALDWQFPRDKEQRQRLAIFANLLQISQGADSAQMLWTGMKAVLSRDKIENPTDIFVSKKEAKKGSKRTKIEAEQNGGKSDQQKERARIRKEAKKLGITTAEYKARLKTQSAPPQPEVEIETPIQYEAVAS
jgi:hypothetical protein